MWISPAIRIGARATNRASRHKAPASAFDAIFLGLDATNVVAFFPKTATAPTMSAPPNVDLASGRKQSAKFARQVILTFARRGVCVVFWRKSHTAGQSAAPGAGGWTGSAGGHINCAVAAHDESFDDDAECGRPGPR